MGSSSRSGLASYGVAVAAVAVATVVKIGLAQTRSLASARS